MKKEKRKNIHLHFPDENQFTNVVASVVRWFGDKKLLIDKNERTILWKGSGEYYTFIRYLADLNLNTKELKMNCKYCGTKLMIAAYDSKKTKAYIRIAHNSLDHKENCPYYKTEEINTSHSLWDNERIKVNLFKMKVWDRLSYISGRYNNVIVLADEWKESVTQKLNNNRIKYEPENHTNAIYTKSIFCIYIHHSNIQFEKEIEGKELFNYEIIVSRKNKGPYYLKLTVDEETKDLISEAKGEDKLLISFNNVFKYKESRDQYLRLWNGQFKPMTLSNVKIIKKNDLSRKGEDKETRKN